MEKQKEWLKPLIVVVAVLLVSVVLVVIGNVITIGDKIAAIHPVLSYLFYGLMTVFFVWLVVLPVIRVIVTPPLKPLDNRDINNYTPSEVTEYVKSGIFTKPEIKAISKSPNRKEEIKKILDGRETEMRKIIKQAAVSNFVITAISQNGSFDFLASIVINFRMINTIVNQSGKRPTYIQLIKLYISVVSASMVIMAIDDVLDNIDFGELLGGVAGKSLNIVLPSLTNGLMNAFVSLRIGYATIKYLQVSSEKFQSETVRKYAIKSARKELAGVAKEGFSTLLKKTEKMLTNVLSSPFTQGNKETEIQT
jgi:hypothetical protein